MKKQLDMHVKSKTLKEPLGDLVDPDDEFKKGEINSPHANFSMSSSRRRKFFPVGKTVPTEQSTENKGNGQPQEISNNKAQPIPKSLSLDKSNIINLFKLR